MLPDLWTTCDLFVHVHVHVHVELVRRLEHEGEQRVFFPVADGELTEQQVGAALRRLRAGGFVDGRGVAELEHPS